MSANKVVKKRPKPTFGETFLSRTVTVKVGPELKKYLIHKPLIMQHSEFFRGAFESQNFKEGVSGEVTLEDVDPVVFEAFIHWLYAQEFIVVMSDNWSKYGGISGLEDVYVTKLYILANRFIAPEFTALALGLAVRQLNSVSAKANTVNLAFASLPENDIFLQVLVDNWCKFHRPDRMVGGQEFHWDLPMEFLRRVINRYSMTCNRLGNLRVCDYLESGSTS